MTVRHGSQVEHADFEALDEAIAAMEERARRIRAEGPLQEINTLRDYGPGDRVHARLELSTGSWLRGREAGLDVMGDGTLVPYVGVIRKRRLELGREQSPFEALREALSQ